MIITICNIYRYSDREKQLLPHFIKHYKDKLKTEIIFCCDQNNYEFHDFCIKNDIKYYASNFEYDKVYGIGDSVRINNIKNKYECWYIPADLDEFISFESKEHIDNLIAFSLFNEYKYVIGYFRDRFVFKDTILDKINPDIEIAKQFPYVTSFTKDVMKACDYKVCLCSPNLDVDAGHHNIKPTDIYTYKIIKTLKNKYINLFVDHYKWFGNILKLEKEKMQIRIKNQSPSHTEQKNLLKHFNSIHNTNYFSDQLCDRCNAQLYHDYNI